MFYIKEQIHFNLQLIWGHASNKDNGFLTKHLNVHRLKTKISPSNSEMTSYVENAESTSYNRCSDKGKTLLEIIEMLFTFPILITEMRALLQARLMNFVSDNVLSTYKKMKFLKYFTNSAFLQVNLTYTVLHGTKPDVH